MSAPSSRRDPFPRFLLEARAAFHKTAFLLPAGTKKCSHRATKHPKTPQNQLRGGAGSRGSGGPGVPCKREPLVLASDAQKSCR